MSENHPEHVLETVGGRKIDPFDLRPEDVDVQDVAFALSNICRWHGHVNRSVLEHSLDVIELVRLQGHPVAVQFAALTHDAQEYVLNDLARGVKRQPSMSAYREAEARAVDVLRELWGIAADEEQERIVKAADDLVMFLEADRWIPSRGRTFSNWTPEIQADVEKHRERFSTPRVGGKMTLRHMFLSAFANLRRGRAGGAIVGVTGYKRSGKDTFGGVLCREGGFARMAFADPIKQECLEFAGVDMADMEKDKKAWRPLWQSRGAFGRRMSATHWIDKMRESIDALLKEEDQGHVYAPSIVITDVRHANEAEFVHEYAAAHGMEALVVRLRRDNQLFTTKDPHESERGVDGVAADRDMTAASAEDVERAARDFLNGKWDEREK